jgi:hypothetical protein
MEAEHRYLFLCHTDSIARYPGNKANDFTVYFPNPLILNGEWEVALVEMGFKEAKSKNQVDVFICCDICDNSLVGEGSLPILKCHTTTSRKNAKYMVHKYGKLCYIALKQHVVSTIRVYIITQTPGEESVIEEASRCTLDLRKKY